MNQRVNPVRFVLALAVLALSAAGCSGGSPSSAQYTPTSTGAAQTPAGVTVSPDKNKVQIVSSCGTHIKIVVLGFQTCRFHEPGYTGSFNVTDHTNGLIGISPASGDKKTLFTVSALLVGSGYFLVEDSNGKKLRVHVKVTLV
ncbi:MAG TPA: hypothetical protein VGF98_00415 [Candidatus Tumulicola sp.]|jgi:hypothetical protein